METNTVMSLVQEAAGDQAHIIFGYGTEEEVGDVLQVRDLFNEVIRQDAVRILPDGNATFLGVGQVRTAGMTLGALDSLLT